MMRSFVGTCPLIPATVSSSEPMTAITSRPWFSALSARGPSTALATVADSSGATRI